ncbi:MAG: flippase-like domain-containing protein, partial [Phycisphaerae bacterium]|nr:flippase-like domain-containing protein [Phycisphaerae bacterium]
MAKITIAALLLIWVLARVHWEDYVVDKDTNKSYAVLASQTDPTGRRLFRVASGILWWSEEQLRPAGDFAAEEGLTVRPGFARTIKSVKLPLLIVATGGFVCSVLTVSMRWWFLLRIQGIHIRRWEAVRLTFLGYFFSLVVPGTVGGDVVKAYYAARHTHKKAAALVSIFVDRVLGLTELAGLATVMVGFVLLSGLASFQQMRVAVYAVCIILVVVAAMLTFLFSRRFRRMLGLQRFYKRLSIAHHFEAAGEAATLYRNRLGALGKAIALTFGAHIVWVSAIGMVGKSLSLPIEFYRYFVYIPIIYIIGAVPLSPGGLGV